MIDLETYLDAAAIDLGPAHPKPTSTNGDQFEATRTLFTSEDGLVEIGVWECTPGHFTADRSTSSEVCHIIAGRATLARRDGEVREIGPGDVLVLPRGWTGAWTVLEKTRKLYVMHHDGS
ncbi:hypothetical protein FHS82_000549 [Pseudochelatococcus lubricantis]|uniref:(S)-ureidoglycine aminohydrolase cupin domain-containing protein n=1 Tax=Pseudochelatococcus lubricantis TaxID=1538102 RepID=A0ABX0V0V8_9HYPH|nr:cupin domain-containing protein [Pseudochelatococcus lubricantis]NIJ56736.1 hypothetical protein [Pseudochelatococcus lubricantis]